MPDITPEATPGQVVARWLAEELHDYESFDKLPERKREYYIGRARELLDATGLAAENASLRESARIGRMHHDELAASYRKLEERLRQAEADLAESRAESEGYGLRMDRVRVALTQAEGENERLRRGCGQHPGVIGYEHPECGFHWHGKDGLDVPAGPMAGGAQEPVCPRCALRQAEEHAQSLAGDLDDAAEHIAEWRREAERLKRALQAIERDNDSSTLTLRARARAALAGDAPRHGDDDAQSRWRHHDCGGTVTFDHSGGWCGVCEAEGLIPLAAHPGEAG